jgi:hypothetical protein
MYKIAIFAILVAISLSSYSYTYSGGTDKYGCHNDHIHGGYHCH